MEKDIKEIKEKIREFCIKYSIVIEVSTYFVEHEGETKAEIDFTIDC